MKGQLTHHKWLHELVRSQEEVAFRYFFAKRTCRFRRKAMFSDIAGKVYNKAFLSRGKRRVP